MFLISKTSSGNFWSQKKDGTTWHSQYRELANSEVQEPHKDTKTVDNSVPERWIRYLEIFGNEYAETFLSTTLASVVTILRKRNPP